MDVGESSKIVAGIFSFEVVKSNSSDGLFNCHSHTLLVTTKKLDYTIYNDGIKKEYAKYGFGKVPSDIMDLYVKDRNDGVPVSKLSREWYESTHGEGINIHCTPMFEGKKIKHRDGKIKKTSLKKQVYEVLKYETKPFELCENKEDLIKVWDSTQGKRRVTKFGFFSGRKKGEWSRILDIYDKKKLWNSLQRKEDKFPDKYNSVSNFSYDNGDFLNDSEYFESSTYYKFKDMREQQSYRRIVIQSVHEFNRSVYELKKKVNNAEISIEEYIKSKAQARDNISYHSSILRSIHNNYKFVLKTIYSSINNLQLDMFSDVIKQKIELHIKKFKVCNPEVQFSTG